MAEQKVENLSNPRLRGALQALMAENDVRHRLVVLEEMLRARFWCPVISSKPPVVDEKGNRSFPEDSMFRPCLHYDRQGKPHMLAFTDDEALNHWKLDNHVDDITCFVFAIEDYANVMLNYTQSEKQNMPDGFVINLSDENLPVDKDQIANLMTHVYMHD